MHLTALSFDHDAHPVEVEWSEALKRKDKTDGATWFHIINDEPEVVAQLLRDDFGFHPVAIKDAVGDHGRPELKEFTDHLFILAPCLAGMDGQVEKYEYVAFFVKGTVLVTVAESEVPCLLHRMEHWSQPRLMPHAEVGYLLYSLLDAIMDDFFPLLDKMEDEVDEIADQIMEGATDRLRMLIVMKRRMLELRRRIGPFRDVMNSLLGRDPDFITPGLSAYYRDLFDNALRLTELIDTNRDALTGLADIHLSTVSNKLNEVMKKMTVISTVLMTAGLIAGIYGMNFKRMPELDWQYGYPFSIGLMLVSGAIVLILFKKQNWL